MDVIVVCVLVFKGMFYMCYQSKELFFCVVIEGEVECFLFEVGVSDYLLFGDFDGWLCYYVCMIVVLIGCLYFWFFDWMMDLVVWIFFDFGIFWDEIGMWCYLWFLVDDIVCMFEGCVMGSVDWEFVVNMFLYVIVGWYCYEFVICDLFESEFLVFVDGVVRIIVCLVVMNVSD